MLTNRRINNMRLSFPKQSVITPRHVQSVFALVRGSLSAFSAPGKSGLGERRSSSTAGGAEATPSSAYANVFDKLFWVAVCQFWSQWKQSLIVVTPETVVRWHRAGFRLYWKLISKVTTQVGRKQTPKEVRELIFRTMAENPTWGAPRIHGELLTLGFDISERTISRWMKRVVRPGEPSSFRLGRLFCQECPLPSSAIRIKPFDPDVVGEFERSTGCNLWRELRVGVRRPRSNMEKHITAVR
jgi:hypothetical protein